MADNESGSRRFDGAPETDADVRFFELRETGYGGWIDQDGYPVDDLATWVADNGITALTLGIEREEDRS